MILPLKKVVSSYFGFINVFNPVSVFLLLHFYCNINCNMGSHRKKMQQMYLNFMSLLYSCCLSCTKASWLI